MTLEVTLKVAMITKKEMLEKKGRFPKKSEWWGPEINQKEWEQKWIQQNPKPIH